MLKETKQLSIKYISIICFLIVGLVPLTFLGWKNIQHEEDDVHREVKEKHQLLAQNLTFPISAYLERAVNDSKLLATKYSILDNELTVSELNYYPKFLSILVVNGDKLIAQQSIYTTEKHSFRDLISKIDCRSLAIVRQQAQFSSIFVNPYSNKPTMFICRPVSNKSSVLLAELDLSYFYALQKSIEFGRKGHAAIVNDKGQVVAHPNQNWVSQIKNISDWKIIQEAKAGKSGTMKFYSEHFEEDMISGFANVPQYQWSVIVPQPISEVNEQVDAITNSHIFWSAIAVLLALLLSTFFTRKISKPIMSLSNEIESIENNDFQGSLHDQTQYIPRELSKLRDSFQKVLHSFQLSNQKLENSNKILSKEINNATNHLLAANIKLQRVVTLDDLTNMYNRRGLQDILTHEVARIKRNSGSFTILLCDLDNFKLINDNYGHAVGDSVLRSFAELSQTALREKDVVGRWGGEEFLCILSDSDYTTSFEIAERLRVLISNTVILPDEIGFNVTVSIGMATYPTDSDVLEELLVCADSALYDAKHSGRNRTLVCKRKKQGFFSVANQLRCALADNAIKVAYQSLFDVSTNQKVASQAMTRIVCDKDNILKAGAFLPTAKQLRLMNHIDKICLESVFSEVSENNNISHILSVSKEFLEDHKNLVVFINCLQNSKNARIIFEISELEFNGNVYEAKRCLSGYISAGVKLSLKNFGGKESSMKFFTEIPFDYIKISDELLNDVSNNDRTMLAISAIVRLCKSLKIKTIAGNVFDEELREIVRKIGFDWIQGYVCEKPILKLSKIKIIEV